MNATAFTAKASLTAILLSVLMIGGGFRTSLANGMDGKIPVFSLDKSPIGRDFPAVYFVFDFKSEKNRQVAELVYSNCQLNVCEAKFHYNETYSEVLKIDKRARSTSWDFHIDFFDFTKKSGAYDGNNQSQFLLYRMYINAKMNKDFGVGYIGIASCKELDLCRYIEDVVDKKSIDFKFYENNMMMLSKYKLGNEVIFDSISAAYSFVKSLDTK
ncbi:hypothetical protein ACQ0MK_16560 [Thalassospira lucentensis]|uniref:hypothetical protein n=1 Tax=Thalassospira lucentensis TaxID=168935 RepID=UPI003D2F252C